MPFPFWRIRCQRRDIGLVISRSAPHAFFRLDYFGHPSTLESQQHPSRNRKHSFYLDSCVGGDRERPRSFVRSWNAASRRSFLPSTKGADPPNQFVLPHSTPSAFPTAVTGLIIPDRIIADIGNDKQAHFFTKSLRF